FPNYLLSAALGEEPPDLGVDGVVSTVAVDFDHDGDNDLAMSAPSRLLVLLNQGDGTFSQGTAFPFESTPAILKAGDLNGDGDTDLAGALVTHHVAVLLDHGSGTFPTAEKLGVGSIPLDLAIGDIDGDLDLDLVSANEAFNVPISGNVSVL